MIKAGQYSNLEWWRSLGQVLKVGSGVGVWGDVGGGAGGGSEKLVLEVEFVLEMATNSGDERLVLEFGLLMEAGQCSSWGCLS